MHVGSLQLALGAEGSRSARPFWHAKNSGASALHRDAILSDKTCRTGLTRGFTGRLARGIHNELLTEPNRSVPLLGGPEKAGGGSIPFLATI
jgi:nitronate monooxygenase